MLPFKWRNKIFLIDALGALSSALFLGLILPLLNTGIPDLTLYMLSGAAVLFCIFSFYSHFTEKHQSKQHLWIILLANISYIMASIYVLLSFYSEINLLGKVYLIIEIILIHVVVLNEGQILADLINVETYFHNKKLKNNSALVEKIKKSLKFYTK
jgi:hypothetical protein